MSRRIARFLMFWFFIALQAMTPFIHTHSGAVPLNHAGFLHMHQAVHSDAAWHVAAADEHDEEVGVAQGMPLRNDTPFAAPQAPLAASLTLPHMDVAARPRTGFPGLQQHWALPDHALPHALAPPSA